MDYDFEIDCFVAWHFSFIYCVRVHGKRTLSNWLWNIPKKTTTAMASPPTDRCIQFNWLGFLVDRFFCSSSYQPWVRSVRCHIRLVLAFRVKWSVCVSMRKTHLLFPPKLKMVEWKSVTERIDISWMIQNWIRNYGLLHYRHSKLLWIISNDPKNKGFKWTHTHAHKRQAEKWKGAIEWDMVDVLWNFSMPHLMDGCDDSDSFILCQRLKWNLFLVFHSHEAWRCVLW